MANLTSLEIRKLEALFKMKKGFLLDFSNAALHAFVFKSVEIDFHQEKYSIDTGSKANRMRALWKLEPDLVVAKLILDLCHYYKYQSKIQGERLKPEEQILFQECVSIGKRLCNSAEMIASLL